MTPRTSVSGKIVVDGFLVAAARETIGSMPILCERRLPINGKEMIGQLGLKSVAMENGQSSEIHLDIGKSRSLPKTYGVPGRNVCTVPDSAAAIRESSLEQAT